MFPPTRWLIYTLMALAGLIAAYTILTAGSPASLWRNVLADPGYDVYVAVASSLVVFVLGFFVFYSRDEASYRGFVEVNAEKIRALRAAGRSDGQIADEMLGAAGSRRGYRHNLAHKKLLLYLSEFR